MDTKEQYIEDSLQNAKKTANLEKMKKKVWSKIDTSNKREMFKSLGFIALPLFLLAIILGGFILLRPENVVEDIADEQDNSNQIIVDDTNNEADLDIEDNRVEQSDEVTANSKTNENIDTLIDNLTRDINQEISALNLENDFSDFDL